MINLEPLTKLADELIELNEKHAAAGRFDVDQRMSELYEKFRTQAENTLGWFSRAFAPKLLHREIRTNVSHLKNDLSFISKVLSGAEQSLRRQLVLRHPGANAISLGLRDIFDPASREAPHLAKHKYFIYPFRTFVVERLGVLAKQIGTGGLNIFGKDDVKIIVDFHCKPSPMSSTDPDYRFGMFETLVAHAIDRKKMISTFVEAGMEELSTLRLSFLNSGDRPRGAKVEPIWEELIPFLIYYGVDKKSVHRDLTRIATDMKCDAPPEELVLKMRGVIIKSAQIREKALNLLSAATDPVSLQAYLYPLFSVLGTNIPNEIVAIIASRAFMTPRDISDMCEMLEGMAVVDEADVKRLASEHSPYNEGVGFTGAPHYDDEYEGDEKMRAAELPMPLPPLLPAAAGAIPMAAPPPVPPPLPQPLPFDVDRVKDLLHGHRCIIA